MISGISVAGRVFCAAMFAAVLVFGSHGYARAHCDTLDGPVVQDARKALEVKDVTPVLKWVRPKDEKTVKAAFATALAERGKKGQDRAEKKFFESLVKVHRAGEGAPFTGLKPAGEVEPAIAEADKALESGTAEAVVKLVNDAVSQGIRQRYEKVAEARKHKDESVQKGREYVAAYVDYTHFVERLHLDASGTAPHHGEGEHKKHKEPRETKQKHGHDH